MQRFENHVKPILENTAAVGTKKLNCFFEKYSDQQKCDYVLLK